MHVLIFPLSRGLFFTFREENIFFRHTTWQAHTYINCMCSIYECKKTTLTWNGASLYEEANLYPCLPHAQSQLPDF